jgi:hypothetical protein
MGPNVNNIDFSEIQGRHWNLAEVKNKSVTINIDRTKTPTDIYSIKFETVHLTGTGAVNFFSASYAALENHRLSILGVARIRADPLYEMDNFTEYEYIRYLQRVNGWDIHGERLELYTYDENGSRAILIFFQDGVLSP